MGKEAEGACKSCSTFMDSTLGKGSHTLFMAWQSCEGRQDVPSSYDGMTILPLLEGEKEKEAAERRMPELAILKVAGEMTAERLTIAFEVVG